MWALLLASTCSRPVQRKGVLSVTVTLAPLFFGSGGRSTLSPFFSHCHVFLGGEEEWEGRMSALTGGPQPTEGGTLFGGVQFCLYVDGVYGRLESLGGMV